MLKVKDKLLFLNPIQRNPNFEMESVKPFMFSTPWPTWQKITFRFIFIYFALNFQPWSWVGFIPGVGWLSQVYYSAESALVNAANTHVFHVRDVLVPVNGSGDTSYAWVQLWLFLSLALFGTILWSILDRKRPHYEVLAYWFRTTMRYYIAMVAFLYGIIKLFCLQMYFPNLSQLATPLGDYLPMRFSWMFIGYSSPYQFFSGLMETIVGLLLLFRRTVTVGLLMGLTVFVNVMMLNLCYDIPVKLFSMHLVVYCSVLLAFDAKRLLTLFVLNKPIVATTLYEFRYSQKWMRYGRIGLKVIFVGVAVILQVVESWERYQESVNIPIPKPFYGVYAVTQFSKNNEIVTPSPTDSLMWRDVIFDKENYGSICTNDTLFRQRYRRGYFAYKVDTIKHEIALKKAQSDSLSLLTLHYDIVDKQTVLLKTKLRNDSIKVVLQQTNRHFQLAERQFHWLSEYNR